MINWNFLPNPTWNANCEVKVHCIFNLHNHRRTRNATEGHTMRLSGEPNASVIIIFFLRGSFLENVPHFDTFRLLEFNNVPCFEEVCVAVGEI